MEIFCYHGYTTTRHFRLTRELAKRRTQQVILSLQRDPDLLQVYDNIINEQEKRGFVEKVSECDPPKSMIHYIPHHPVRKETATTPIRIVYDCSCRSSRHSPSLNDCLMSTPPKLNDITSLFLWFRSTPPNLNDITSLFLLFRSDRYESTTDIEKAFSNIGLTKEDRDVTRFYWLSNPADPNSALQNYRYKSVLFEATCLPFILNDVIMKHMDSNKCTITDLLLSYLYVDNIISSLPCEEMVRNYFTTSRDIFRKLNSI